MVKLIYIIMPYPRLITQGIRSDFEGTLNIIHRINDIMKLGLYPINEKTLGKMVKPKDTDFRSVLKRYLRHYHPMSHEVFEITHLFKKTNENTKLKVAYAYGNVLEFTFENLQVDEVFERFQILSDLDSHLQSELFEGIVGKKIFEMYLGKEVLVHEKNFLFLFSPILTVYFMVVIAENKSEFDMIVKRAISSGMSLRDVGTDLIKVGTYPATNFISSPFFNVTINPVIVLPPEKYDHRFNDAFGEILNSMACIGELYNILELIDDAHELCVIASYNAPFELNKNIGSLRINPFRNIRDIYGLRSFKKYEGLFHSLLYYDVTYMRKYGTKSAEIIWKQEGVFHFPAISELISLAKTYSGGIESILFKIQEGERNSRKKFLADVFKTFEERFKSLRTTMEEFVKDTIEILEAARTTVQLNLAIVTLLLTLILTILPVQAWIEKLLIFLRSVIN